MKTIGRNTHELRQGDVIRHHGMDLLIDQEIRTPIHFPEVRVTRAKILNLPEVLEAGIVPRSWIEEEGRWVIQGNELAGWAVEVEA